LPDLHNVLHVCGCSEDEVRSWHIGRVLKVVRVLDEFVVKLDKDAHDERESLLS
jgi:hypothetical protein